MSVIGMDVALMGVIRRSVIMTDVITMGFGWTGIVKADGISIGFLEKKEKQHFNILNYYMNFSSKWRSKFYLQQFF